MKMGRWTRRTFMQTCAAGFVWAQKRGHVASGGAAPVVPQNLPLPLPRRLPFRSNAVPLSFEAPVLVVEAGVVQGISELALSPGGQILAAADVGGVVQLMECQTGAELRRFSGHAAGVLCLAFASEKVVASGSADGTASLWDAATGQELQRFSGHRQPIRGIAQSERYVLTGSADKTARLWDPKTGQEISQLGDAISPVHRVAISPDESDVLIGRDDGTVEILELQPRQRRGRVRSGYPRCMRFSPDGKSFLTGTPDGSVSASNTLDGSLIRRLSGLVAGAVLALEFGDSTIVGINDLGDVVEWDAHTGKVVRQRRLPGERPLTIALDIPAGVVVIDRGLTGVEVMRWPELDESRVQRPFGMALQSVAAPDDPEVLLVGTDANAAVFWDTGYHGLQPAHKPATPFLTQTAEIVRTVASDDGQAIAIGSELFSRGSPTADRFLSLMLDHREESDCLSISTKGRYAVFRGGQDGLQLRDARNGTCTRLPAALAQAAAFSKDENRIATVHIRVEIKIWETSTAKLLYEFRLAEEAQGLPSTIASIVYHPTDHELLTACYDGDARLLDSSTGRELRRFRSGSRELMTAKYSEDGNRIVTGGADGRVRCWNRQTGDMTWVSGAFGGAVADVAFKNRRGYVAAVGADARVRLLRISDGTEICSLISFRDGGWAVASPDGRMDADNLESLPRLHWVFPDDPFRTISSEAFLRNYYEPRLLSRLLHPRDAEEFQPIQPLQKLNRARPTVRVAGVTLDGRGRVSVLVEVCDGRLKAADGREWSTAAYDLRLFRDGQLVGRCPEPQTANNKEVLAEDWQKTSLVSIGNDPRVREDRGRAHVRFEGILLPHRAYERVRFTAYAFNSDGVRSAASTFKIT